MLFHQIFGPGTVRVDNVLVLINASALITRVSVVPSRRLTKPNGLR